MHADVDRAKYTHEDEGEAVAAAVGRVEQWFGRINSLVIGPGMGRDKRMLMAARGIIDSAKVRDAQESRYGGCVF
jgi:hypothetical protein